jgi:hypothetical protein
VRGRSVVLGWREVPREKGEGCKKAIPGTPVTENKSRRKTLDYRTAIDGRSRDATVVAVGGAVVAEEGDIRVDGFWTYFKKSR